MNVKQFLAAYECATARAEKHKPPPQKMSDQIENFQIKRKTNKGKCVMEWATETVYFALFMQMFSWLLAENLIGNRNLRMFIKTRCVLSRIIWDR
jgi:hypothetical protein